MIKVITKKAEYTIIADRYQQAEGILYLYDHGHIIAQFKQWIGVFDTDVERAG
jgi:hypothetical protein